MRNQRAQLDQPSLLSIRQKKARRAFNIHRATTELKTDNWKTYNSRTMPLSVPEEHKQIPAEGQQAAYAALARTFRGSLILHLLAQALRQRHRSTSSIRLA